MLFWECNGVMSKKKSDDDDRRELFVCLMELICDKVVLHLLFGSLYFI